MKGRFLSWIPGALVWMIFRITGVALLWSAERD